jgi:RNA polymerase sigma-70 factor (ECF subfamily)
LTAIPNSAAQKNATDDLANVDRVLAGDVQAFEGIVRRWQGPLINMAWRYCRDRSRAEDLAQEAFIRAWRGLAQWRRESSFSTWLFALAANVFRSELKRFPAVNLPLDAAPEPSGPAAQHHALAARLNADSVRRAVLALPHRYREPVVLFYFHEMDVAAAARTMGLPASPVRGLSCDADSRISKPSTVKWNSLLSRQERRPEDEPDQNRQLQDKPN